MLSRETEQLGRWARTWNESGTGGLHATNRVGVSQPDRIELEALGHYLVLIGVSAISQLKQLNHSVIRPDAHLASCFEQASLALSFRCTKGHSVGDYTRWANLMLDTVEP